MNKFRWALLGAGVLVSIQMNSARAQAASALEPLVPESFKQLWKQAEQSSPLLKSHAYRIEQTENSVKATQAQQRWQLNWQGELSAAQMKQSFTRTANNLTLSYPLYQPQLSMAESVKQAQSQVAQWQYQAQRRELLNQVATLYARWLTAQEKKRFAEREIHAIQAILQQLNQRYQLGLVQLNQISEVQSRLAQMQVVALQAQQQADKLWQELIAKVGKLPFSRAQALKGLATDESVQKMQNALRAILKNCQNPQSCRLDLAEHPQLKALQNQIGALQQKEEQVKARYAPKVTVFGSYVYNDSGDRFYDDMQGVKAGIQFQVPLYVSNADAAEQAEQHAALKSVQAQLLQTRQNLQARAQTVWQDLTALSQQASLLMQARHATEQAVKATEAGLKTGERTILDVLNAQRDWDEAQLNLYSTQYEVWRAVSEWIFLQGEVK